MTAANSIFEFRRSSEIHYVYSHAKEGKVIYIGSGIGFRANKWQNRKYPKEGISIALVSTHHCREEAREAEKALILSCAPEYNLTHTPRTKQGGLNKLYFTPEEKRAAMNANDKRCRLKKKELNDPN
jgi:hypothetical protein